MVMQAAEAAQTASLAGAEASLVMTEAAQAALVAGEAASDAVLEIIATTTGTSERAAAVQVATAATAEAIERVEMLTASSSTSRLPAPDPAQPGHEPVTASTLSPVLQRDVMAKRKRNRIADGEAAARPRISEDQAI